MVESNVQIQMSSCADSNEEESSKQESCSLPLDKRICLVGAVVDDESVVRAAQTFGVPVLTSETGAEYIADTTCVTVFVLDTFEGPIFEKIHKSGHRILGPIALRQLSEEHEPLPNNTRPLYNVAMRGVVVCFTGFRKKEDLTRMIPLIHHMGGSIRKDVAAKVTHLIAHSCGGDKYQYAFTFRVPIMSADWVYDAWQQREDITLKATQDTFLSCRKLQPFHGARVCFIGFSTEETEHMREVLTSNGGIPSQADDPLCSHVVMDNGQTYNVVTPQLSNPQTPTTHFHSPDEQIVTSANISLDNFDYTMNLEDISQDPLEPISEEIFDNKQLSEILQVDSPLKRKRDDSDISIIDLPPKLEHYDDACSTPIVRNVKKRRLSITPRFVEMLRTPISFFTSKRRQSIATATVSRHLEPSASFVSSSGIFNISPSESLENLSISKTYCSTPVLEDCTPNKSHSAGSKPPEQSHRLSRKNLRKSLRKQKKSQTDTDNAVKSANSGIFLDPGFQKIDTNLKTKFKPQFNLNMPTLETTHIETVFEDYPTELLTTPSVKASGKTPQTVPRIVISNGFDNLKRKEKLLNLSKRHSICVVESGRNLFNAHDVDSSRSPSPSPPPSPYEQPDGLQKLQRWRLRSHHLVVDESAVAERPEIVSRAHIVKAAWFWASVQNATCADEKDYLFDDYLESILSPSRRDSRSGTPSRAAGSAPATSASGRRKRKRQHGLNSLVRGAASLSSAGPVSPGLHKRRSSISDAGLLSVSGSFLDCTASPDKSLIDEPEGAAGDLAGLRKNLSPRQQVFIELVQTESNYVNILHTIMMMFKSHLEDMPEEEALLNNTELKIIFGNLPPIYDTHNKMLEELRWASAHWSEDTSIGNIFLKYSADLIKAYPPFVNFFETMKEALVHCDTTKPRFHAFLKVCQTRPECGRQSLQELLIRPVQRLPSITLLLGDILKHTSKSNPDHSALEKALTSVRDVITIINEDKRKTEGMVVMFNIHDQIDKCPADLVSSHRNFVTRCEVQELSEGLSGRGDTLVLFLFTDTLEVCKKPKPKKGSNSQKSPITVNGLHPSCKSTSTANKLPFKHVRLMPLSAIKRVIDIRETDDCHKVFALMCRNNQELNRNNQELKEELYYFTILEEDVNKTTFLRTLCRQMANTVCKADADKFLACLDAHQLNIKTSDVAGGTLSRANLYKFAEKTRMKVGRAFSFNKTPLKRAVSSMMSPFGSSANLTPSSQLAQMRLASCNNINELGGGNAQGSPSPSEALVAPMSVQPTRKAKCSSLSIAALRRL